MNKNYIPRKDADFLLWTNNFIDNLGALLTQTGFPSLRFEQLITLHNEFVQKYNLAENPITRTAVSILDKNESRATLVTAIRHAVKEYLTYNSALTDADRSRLGLPVYKTSRTPSPVATSYPEYDVDSSIIRRLTIHFYNSGSKLKAKPDGQHGAEIKWGILDAPPATISDLSQSSFDTRTPFTLVFDENQRGKTVYFCLCWENTRGEKGPWSEIVSAIVP